MNKKEVVYFVRGTRGSRHKQLKVLTASEELMEGMSALMARYQSRQISERVKRALQAKKERLAAEKK